MTSDNNAPTDMKTGKQSLRALMEQGGGLSGFPWPEHISEFDMRIKRDGSWLYQGSPITRLALCKLFATVLQRDEAGDYWLVTPVERGRVVVEDAPFVAVEMKVEGEGRDQNLSFRTNLGHWVKVNEAHPLRFETDLETEQPSPYVMIRDGLEALINRAVFYDLVDLAVEEEIDGQNYLGLWSAGQFFKLGPSIECD